jgi:epoxyqueuosine reductase
MTDTLKEIIIREAKILGFDLIGFASPSSLPSEKFSRWIENEYHADMKYLSNNLEKRHNPIAYQPEVKTIISTALNYHQSDPPNYDKTIGKIARYAWGKDYHHVLTDRLGKLAHNINSLIGGGLRYRICVDSSPVLEKPIAQSAGIGWIGKNGLLINKTLGSFLVLGELFINLEIPPDTPEIDRCGKCRKCIDACPTKAIVEPQTIDCRRCISYLTIEHKGEIPSDISKKITDHIFGCDLCQNVCPFNQSVPETNVPEFKQHVLGPAINPSDVLRWNEKNWKEKTSGSSAARTKLTQWQRNAHILASLNEPRP